MCVEVTRWTRDADGTIHYEAPYNLLGEYSITYVLPERACWFCRLKHFLKTGSLYTEADRKKEIEDVAKLPARTSP